MRIHLVTKILVQVAKLVFGGCEPCPSFVKVPTHTQHTWLRWVLIVLKSVLTAFSKLQAVGKVPLNSQRGREQEIPYTDTELLSICDGVYTHPLPKYCNIHLFGQ